MIVDVFARCTSDAEPRTPVLSPFLSAEVAQATKEQTFILKS